MNINYTQVIKKQTQIIALSVFVMVIGILGVSYALFMKVDQSEEQTVQSGSLIMQLSAYDGSTVITDNNTPIDDNEGLLSKGYSFSVTNNGTLPITYYIALYDNPDDTSTNKVNYDYIKVSLDNGTPFILGSITSKDSAGRYILKQDISLAPDKYDTHNIKIWLDEDTPESEIGKTISLKIYAYGEVCEDGECNGGTLPPVKKVISQLDTTGKCPTVNEDGSVNVTGAEATDGYICNASDAYGTSYYYRGNVTNNYVLFADKYWRIVRINGDGTVRVIYDGTSAHSNGEASEDRQIGKSSYNNYYWKKDNIQDNSKSSLYLDNAGVGYMYGNQNGVVTAEVENSKNITFENSTTYYISKEYIFDESTNKFSLKDPIAIQGNTIAEQYIGYYTFGATSTNGTGNYIKKISSITAGTDSASVGWKSVIYGTASKEQAQTNNNDSTIKEYLDNWYEQNLKGSNAEQYIVDNIFCNDRSLASENTGTGAGMSITNYRWYNMPWDKNNNVSLLCQNKNDAFTKSASTNGNGNLKYSIGLLSADEIALAGAINTNNTQYYLYTGNIFWTSSPSSLTATSASVVSISKTGAINNKSSVPYSSGGVRPVLNLKSDVLTYGDGTSSNPYRLTENF